MSESAALVSQDGGQGDVGYQSRRAYIIQLLAESASPLTVQQVAEHANIHVNTARFHLESLVHAGLAARKVADRASSGRPPVVYSSTPPERDGHEQAQAYQLLATMLTTAIAQADPDSGAWMYDVGKEWGRFLTSRPAPFESLDESTIAERLIDKLDALWFAPEINPEKPNCLTLHNCPFKDPAHRFPEVVCRLHGGMINGSLEEMSSRQRLVGLHPDPGRHICTGFLADSADDSYLTIELTDPGQTADNEIAQQNGMAHDESANKA